VIGALALAALLLPACTLVSASDVDSVVGPPQNEFPPVDAYLVKRCGSLDCHGQAGRNLRLYGYHGLRLAKGDDPNGRPTTQEEIDADYDGVVGLEPETMTLVVTHGGEHPEKLSLIAKPAGLEEHKGGQLFEEGDAQYTCLTSWLSSNVDANACSKALKSP
jgi:hypothetical protein